MVNPLCSPEPNLWYDNKLFVIVFRRCLSHSVISEDGTYDMKETSVPMVRIDC